MKMLLILLINLKIGLLLLVDEKEIDARSNPFPGVAKLV